jgi:hypothetical protein
LFSGGLSASGFLFKSGFEPPSPERLFGKIHEMFRIFLEFFFARIKKSDG